MGIVRPADIASTVIAAVLVGILAGFQIPAAKSATTPQPAAPQTTGAGGQRGPR